MKIHWLQHVPFEGLGCMESWLIENGYVVTCTRLWEGGSLPRIGDLDGLIIMGGPMGIYEEEEHPWLAAEKSFIQKVISKNKPVLGICLGAQLIADVLGAPVGPGLEKEIGFFDCSASGPLASKDWNIPVVFTAFHWHGDTFGIPDGAVRLVSSAVTENQAFLYNGNVLALQFHLETTEESLLELYKYGADEVVAAPTIQPLDVALNYVEESVLMTCNVLMNDFLGSLFGSAID